MKAVARLTFSRMASEILDGLGTSAGTAEFADGSACCDEGLAFGTIACGDAIAVFRASGGGDTGVDFSGVELDFGSPFSSIGLGAWAATEANVCSFPESSSVPMKVSLPASRVVFSWALGSARQTPKAI